MAIVVRELRGNYDFGTEIGAVLLWREEAEIHREYDSDDFGGDADDVADNAVLFWSGVADFGVAEHGDFADVGVCDGIDVFGGSGRGDTWNWSGDGIFGNQSFGFSHWSGGVFRTDEKFSGGDGNGAGVGIRVICDDFGAVSGGVVVAKMAEAEVREYGII